MNSKRVSEFRKAVLEHWKKHGRHELPWRQTHDPYRILVSEVMLQQTQVERVIPYYTRFLKKYPTVQKLAKSQLADVLKLWSGLGYNRRAKLLRDTAIAVVENHGGVFPRSREELIDLPGIGPYTAGAVRAFAFDEGDVFIETNIRTVILHHFFSRSKDVPDTKLLMILEALLKDIKSPRQWYSALMDYGSYLKKLHPNPSRKSAHHSKQSKFEGSLRQARGAILKVLNDAPKNGLTERQICTRCYLVHVATALTGLEKDGLIRKQNGRWSIA